MLIDFVLRKSAVKDDRRKRVWQNIDVRHSQRSQFRNSAERIALAPTLDTKEANGVSFV